MDETDRLTIKDAAPFVLVVLVTLAVIGFIVTASSAHAEERTEAQGVPSIEQTVAYAPGKADLLPAVLASDANVSFNEVAEISSWNPAKVNNAVNYKVSVENRFGSEAYFRTVVALEASADGDALTFLNANTEAFSWSKVNGTIEVEGVDYLVYVAVYEGIENEEAGTTANGKLANGSSVDVVTQVAMKSSVVSSDVATLGNGYNIMVMTQAVEIIGDDPASDLNTAFGKITADSHPWNRQPSTSDSSSPNETTIEGSAKQ